MKSPQDCYFCDPIREGLRIIAVSKPVRIGFITWIKHLFPVLLVVTVCVSTTMAKNSAHFKLTNQQLQDKNNNAPVITGDFNLLAETYLHEHDSLVSSGRNPTNHLLYLAIALADENKITDTTLLAALYHRKGKLLDSEQMYKEALAAFAKSIKYKLNQNPIDSSLLAQSYNYKGITFMRLNNFDSALVCFNTALIYLTNYHKHHRDLFDVHLNKGIIKAILGRYDEAYSNFQQSYHIIQDTLLTGSDSLMTAMFYYNYGLMATTVGKTTEAITYYNISENYHKKLRGERHKSIAGINLNMGINSYFSFDFQKGKLLLSKALDIYLENEDFKIGVPKSLYNLGAISIITNNYREAIEYSRLGLSYQPENDYRLLLTLNLAKAYNLSGNIPQADEQYRAALALLNKEDVSPTRKPAVYEQYADFLMISGNTDSAYAYLKRGLSESRKLYGNDSELNAYSLTQIGNFFLHRANNPDSALLYFNAAITLWDNTDSLERANLNKTQYAQALVGNALAQYALAKQTGHIDFLLASEAAFYRVLQQMQQLSLTLTSENKITLAQMLKPFYQQAVGVEFELFSKTGDNRYLERGFAFSESAKSTALVASVNNQVALKTADLPQETFQAENQLKNNITTIRRILADETEKPSPDERKTSYYKSKLLQMITSYDSLIRRLETDYPKYYQMKYNNAVISSAQIQRQLNPDELFIEYEMSDSVLYRIILGNDFSKFDKIRLNERDIEALTRLISIKNIRVETENYQSFRQFCRDAHLWYNKLIGDVSSENKGYHLAIVPDGLLGYLPFEMLLDHDPQTDTINYRDLPYVIINHPISYTPSGSLKFNTFFQSTATEYDNNLLAFAPSYNDTISVSETNGRELPLKSLPFAKTEALEISKLMHGQAFTEDMATKNTFTEIAGNYGLLHLSMHTLLNDSLPMMSKLVFYDSHSDSSNPYLNIYEIYGLSFNAKQVTLSACNTGFGKFKKGEGIMSLARSFIFAGVPAIVMTLWDVQDENGSLLMQHYYKLLGDGLEKDEALQQAKIHVLKSANMVKSHPFFWSSYVLSGDTSAITTKHNKALWISGVVAAGVLLFFYFRLRRRKK